MPIECSQYKKLQSCKIGEKINKLIKAAFKENNPKKCFKEYLFVNRKLKDSGKSSKFKKRKVKNISFSYFVA